MSPEILITGGRGMLGRDLAARLGGRAVAYDVEECDITDAAAVARTLDDLRPAHLVNCAAWTDVDGAETREADALRLNAEAPEILARACRGRGIHFITISTDYVFTGEGSAPWPEDAPPEAFGPRNAYGRTKLEGERRVAGIGGDWCIARTQWLYGAGGKNFPDTMVKLGRERERLRVVDDQVGALTWSVDLAEALERLIDARATGFYHCVNGGWGSWCDVARRVMDRLGLPCQVDACGSDEFPRPAHRPFNSRMRQEKYARLAGAPLRPWQEALDEYLAVRHGAAASTP